MTEAAVNYEAPGAVITPKAQGSNAPLGLNTIQGFEAIQRIAKGFSQSTLVPKEYHNNLPNCIVAVNMALRLNADPLMVMQNLYVIQGKPSWSSSFLIATFNGCGGFSKLRYEFVGKPGSDDYGCRAYATELATGKVLSGATVTIDTAKKEGWYSKSGSKWLTMPEQMLMYRAAAWFIRAYAPELAMGMHTVDEVADFTDAEVVEQQKPQAEPEPEPKKGRAEALKESLLEEK